MFNYREQKKCNKASNSSVTSSGYALTSSLEGNIKMIRDIFNNNDSLTIRRFENQQNTDVKCCIFFIDGMVNNEIINENIIQPIVHTLSTNPKNMSIDSIMHHTINSNSVKKTTDVDTITDSILNGDTVLFLEGSPEGLTISAKGWQTRSITEPEAEKSIRGPREGFTESLMVNLSMIRRKLLTPDLKFKYRTIGTRSHTKICLCYLQSITDVQILNELENRLDVIDIDGVLDTGYIQELIKDSPYSPFKTLGSTERPDVVAGKLLEGRIAVFMEGTPFVLTLPFIFIEYFQAGEDYYDNFYFGSINRIFRILSFILSTGLPAVFVSLTTFHQEMIPSNLIKSLAAARLGVPFPTVVEVLMLLIAFEFLRETGTRLPTQVGQALSIVGALVIGQAAVEARFVSAPIIITVALTGITGLMIPRLKDAVIITRLAFLFLASTIGLYGYIFGIIGLLLHLFELRSFGIPYMLNIVPHNLDDLKDTAVRGPWWSLRHRPRFLTNGNRTRNASGGRKK